MRFLRNTNIDFIGQRKIYFAITIIMTIIAGYAFIKNKGPVLGLEFTGGTVVEIGFKELPPIDKIREEFTKEGLSGFSLQTQPSNNSLIVRVKESEASKHDLAHTLIDILKKSYPDNVNAVANRVEYIGPVVGKQLVWSAYGAIFWSLLFILGYVAFRFRNWTWGAGGVLALGHDVFMTWGLLTLLGRETTLVVIAALLTLAGYSINDTIVVFDRVRENLRSARKETNRDLYNRSLNETLSRTINTSLTAFMASLCLYFLGGEVIHDFALAMSFGIAVGTYSSVGIALSLVYEFEEFRKTRKS